MVNVITELSKYVMVLFLALYTLVGFQLVRKPEEEKKSALWQQNILFFFMHLLGILILYLNAFGFAKTERFFTVKTYKKMSFAALACYSLAKSYSFYTGANHIESVIPLGTPGAILSSGLILILNICVGVVVAGTMYTFYVMFRKGGY